MIGENGKILKIDGDGYPITWMHSMSLNSILKNGTFYGTSVKKRRAWPGNRTENPTTHAVSVHTSFHYPRNLKSL